MRYFTALVLTVLLLSAPAAASNSDLVTGEDWVKRMSDREKFMSLVPPAVLFSDYDVHLTLSLPRYIFLIDRLMGRNPRLADEEVANLFASTIYFFEPENRSALREMEMSFLEGDFESRRGERLRLTIEELLDETPDA
jgi:hypothetical protein